MAGPTVLDLVEITDELAVTDVLYAIRGVGVGADRFFTADKIVPSILTTNITGAINLNTYKGDLVIFSTPAAAITLTFANMLPNGRKIIIVNKATAFGITCAGTFVDIVHPSTTIYRVSDATSFYDLEEKKEKYDVIIDSQATFEYYFGTGDDVGVGATGTTQAGWVCVDVANDETVTVPKDMSILLKSNPADGVTTHFKYDATNYPWKAYELNTRVNLQTGQTIHGEGIDQTIIARAADDYPMFITDFMEQEAVTGVATNDFTVASSANFQEGQTIEHSNDNAFYKVTSVPDGTSVIVDRNITGAAAGNITVCQDSVETKDFTFDGRCDVDNLGGAQTKQAFNLQYCAHSNFEAKVINCKDATGGGYHGNDLIYRLKIKNIFHCEVSEDGGACYQCSNSDISDIYNCIAYSAGVVSTEGGACYGCNYCNISNIFGCRCESTLGVRGGVCRYCEHCNISNIYDCDTIAGTTAIQGGMLSECSYSTIKNIYNCRTLISDDNVNGGVCYECNYSDISNIHDCSTTITGVGSIYGGVCNNCDYSTIKNIYNCTSDNTTPLLQGGACNACDFCDISNIFGCVCNSTTGATEGGGCFGCNNGTIGNINNCTVNNTDDDAVGGAAAECGFVVIIGNFNGNLDDPGGGAATDTFSAMTNYCNNFIHDGTAVQNAGAGPTDWD